jgi:hypothetical protein
MGFLVLGRVQVDGPLPRVLAILIVAGLFGTYFGGYHCIAAYTYAEAAQHETTAVGRVVRISASRSGGSDWDYVFSINGVEMDDYSEVCATPLASGACDHKGPVLVYYSYKPYSNSRLEDFAVAARKAYRTGGIVLAVSLPCLVLSCAGMVKLARKNKGEGDSDREDRERSSEDNEARDGVHIAPGE